VAGKGFDLLERGRSGGGRGRDGGLAADGAGAVGRADAGAKVVLVGDPEQLQAIEAGGAFRAVAERVGSVEITAVRRQREGWQQEATKELATGRTEAALDREAAGWYGHDTPEEARPAWWRSGAARQAAPDERRSCWRIGGWMCRR
jgi:hypothetical protein